MLQILVPDLARRIVDQDVESAQRLDGFLHELDAVLRVAQVARERESLLARVFNGLEHAVRIRLLLRKVRNGQIRAFLGISHGHSRADARIATSNESLATLQAPMALIGLNADIGLRLQLDIQARVLLVLLRRIDLGEFRAWVGHDFLLHRR